MASAVKVVLFISVQNAARSILAEALVNELGQGRLRAYSAGQSPLSEPEPLALVALKYFKIPSNGFNSKSWELHANGLTPLDYVISIGEPFPLGACPRWPGAPMESHWSVTDPATVKGTRQARLRAYIETAILLRDRAKALVASALETSDRAMSAASEHQGRPF